MLPQSPLYIVKEGFQASNILYFLSYYFNESDLQQYILIAIIKSYIDISYFNLE